MFINDAGVVFTSASDLAAFASCEFAFLRRLDAKLGRVDPIADDPDALGKKTIELGVAHELAVLAGYKATGLDVVELTRATSRQRSTPQTRLRLRFGPVPTSCTRRLSTSSGAAVYARSAGAPGCTPKTLGLG